MTNVMKTSSDDAEKLFHCMRPSRMSEQVGAWIQSLLSGWGPQTSDASSLCLGVLPGKLGMMIISTSHLSGAVGRMTELIWVKG